MAIAGARRGPYRDEDDVGACHGGRIAGELQTLASPPACDYGLKFGLVDRHLAATERRDLRFVDVDAGYVVSGLREARSRYQSNIARAKYRKPHFFSFLVLTCQREATASFPAQRLTPPWYYPEFGSSGAQREIGYGGLQSVFQRYARLPAEVTHRRFNDRFTSFRVIFG